ncbi:MAG: hypothetical protein P8N47_00515 [Bacteroidia bacterium]|jgi:ElaB/YqjD/DUF883 family membrane-anchored ribosome-binding protein|nr:hypothetical protein [Bacteroidia bacterium]
MKKSKIHAACMEKLQNQVNELQSAIDKVQESIVGEDNSTAGNKFETARAMGQEELDRLNQTMNHAIKEFTILSQISPNKPCTTAQLGAHIVTDKKELYLATGIGRLVIGEKTIFVTSPTSPVGQQLMGLEKDGELAFAGKKEKILSVA